MTADHPFPMGDATLPSIYPHQLSGQPAIIHHPSSIIHPSIHPTIHPIFPEYLLMYQTVYLGQKDESHTTLSSREPAIQ